jgi:Enoyl-(Acyl carrier protein) reductase
VTLADLGRAGEGAELAGQVDGMACDVDVSDPAAVASAVEQAENRLGPIEVAVCCAGFDHDRSLEETDDELWSRSLRVLLGGGVNVRPQRSADPDGRGLLPDVGVDEPRHPVLGEQPEYRLLGLPDQHHGAVQVFQPGRRHS